MLLMKSRNVSSLRNKQGDHQRIALFASFFGKEINKTQLIHSIDSLFLIMKRNNKTQEADQRRRRLLTFASTAQQ